MTREENMADVKNPFTSWNQNDLSDNSSLELNNMAMLEAVLFAVGDPVAFADIVQIMELSEETVRELLEKLTVSYANNPSTGIALREVEGKYLLTTKAQTREFVARVYRPRYRAGLSKAAYETLAAVLYNEPCTRAQIETVRGVNSDSLVTRLVERDLLQEVGNLEVPGRPALFAVTEKFLLEFGLKSRKDLPKVDFVMYKTLEDMDKNLQNQAEESIMPELEEE